MVYIKSWTEFEQSAGDLYTKSGARVRYCVKFRPKTGQLVLRLTDDTTCIAYKTFSSIILNRFELLNQRLLGQIANLPKPPPPNPADSLVPPQTQPIRATSPGVVGEDDPMNGTGSGGRGTPVPTAEEKKQPAAGGGGKKKKKGKR